MKDFTRCKVIDIIDKKSIKVVFEGETNCRLITPDDSRSYLFDCIWKGVILNVSDNRIVVQPDYLLDISAIASCFSEVGSNALHYIYNLVIPSKPNAYNILGNTVNLFFDDRVENSSRSYMDCLVKTFHDNAVQFLSIDENDLRKIYFNTIADQYSNVIDVVDNQFGQQAPALNKENGLLEPSFICPQLGLSGRMDYLELHGNKEASIIELKSGKRDEWRKSSKMSHLIQTLLYAESLHYSCNIDYNNIHSYLLYNKYPLLSRESYSSDLVNRALVIRNQIIGHLHRLAIGEGQEIFTSETVNAMYPGYHKIWDDYMKPELLEAVAVIENSEPEIKVWFFNQLKFILREEEITRLGDSGSVYNDRSSANIWLNSFEQKCADGKIISPMTVDELLFNDEKEVYGLKFTIKSDDDYTSHDFRKGDSVILYPIESIDTKANERIILHANISAITDTSITVELRHTERVIYFSSIADQQFACEHDIFNSNASHSCRSLYLMLKSSDRWKDLLIKGATPQANDYEEKEASYVDNLVGRILNSKEYFVLVGPPGTGKTSVVLRKLMNRLYSETQENILLLSFTHRAIDEICSCLEDIIENDNGFMDYCRLGSDYECNDERFRIHLLSNYIDNCKRRSDLLQKINDMRVFVSTTSRININHSLLDIKKFDTIIVDESSQLLDYQLIELLTNAKRFILIGDHKQLPAVTLQESSNNLFERLYCENLKKNPSVVGQLIHHGRMHRDIASFANEMFYANALQPIPLPHQLEEDALLPRYKFVDIKPISTELYSLQSNKCNIAEAVKVAEIVKEIFNKYRENNFGMDAKTIGIIVPYRNQISAIRKELALRDVDYHDIINIDTVERYQGSQRDIIIFSATVSTDNQLKQLSCPVDIDGTLVDRKLNVIITRARKHLFIIGNKELLSKNTIYRNLIEKMS